MNKKKNFEVQRNFIVNTTLVDFFALSEKCFDEIIATFSKYPMSGREEKIIYFCYDSGADRK